MLRALVERLPAMIRPRRGDTRSQPIAVATLEGLRVRAAPGGG
jgi:hypothetical protein